MRSRKNILVAFLLNITFSLFEFVGGLLSGSVAVFSDAVHDLGDAVSIGLAYLLERKSARQPDELYTYGYLRYSVLGGLVTTVILMVGSLLVTVAALQRIVHPVPVHYDGMIAVAVVGLVVNLVAAWVTREGDSLNQKAVNLHMLEDVLGWAVVLLGAIIMRFTDISLIDPLMSIGVACFIFIHSVGNLREVMALFLEKVPSSLDVEELRHHVLEIAGVQDVHHIHIWSMDGQRHYATMHVVSDADPVQIKAQVRKELAEHGIGHVTLELETTGEACEAAACRIEPLESHGHHRHHYHHH